MSRRFVVSLAAVLTVCVTQSGCTIAMWEAAGRTTVDADHVAGRATDAAGRPAVAVNYRVSAFFGERRYVLVPVDADGRPAPPFATGRPTVAPTGGLDDVPADQRAAILTAVRFGAPEPADLTPAACAPGGRAMPFVGADGDLKVAAYRVGEDGALIAEQATTVEASSNRLTGNRRMTFALVPARLPRSKADLFRARFGATVLTPVTVVVDLALIPAYPVLLVTGVISR